MAFYDPDLRGEAAARAYLLSRSLHSLAAGRVLALEASAL